MKQSPLQLLSYFVPEMSFSANQLFSQEKSIEGGIESFSVEAEASQQKAPNDFPGHSWSVQMVIAQDIKEGQNFPYRFKLIIVGMFALKEGVMTDDKESQFVKVNGSSIVYGVARELMRSATCLGPWGSLIIPTVSFYESAPMQKEESAPLPKAD
jgi:preprotein translocase subunit SecB